MKKCLLLLLFFPFIAHAWTLAEIQSNMQMPPGAAKLDCHGAPEIGGYAFTTNAQNGTVAGTDNAKLGYSPTTNVTTAPNGSQRATGNAAMTFYKNINIYYVYGGQNKVAVIPAATYWGNPTSSWRQTDNEALAYIPSTGLANSLRITSYPYHWTDLYNGQTFMTDFQMKVTINLPNGSPAHFWFDCFNS